jgi:bifunctional UDP-N-acetylglucosamine pyrophosphorylase/glucosamine-1-phosphate N-acetyltransferase
LTGLDNWLYLIVATPKMPKLHNKISTVILAAGIGKRMRSKTPKILHHVLGKPIIAFVSDLARDIGSEQIILVVGDRTHGTYTALGNDISLVVQDEPLGSGDAAKQGLKAADCKKTLILCGDVPLLTKQTVLRLLQYHEEKNADLTILTCKMDDPFGYGRIIRKHDDSIAAIIEQSDATPEQNAINEINAGVYFGRTEIIAAAIQKIDNKNKQGEYYLTDAIRNIAASGKKVCGYMIDNEAEIIGVNTKSQLAQVRAIVKRQWFEELMQRGVYIEDPQTTDIDLSVKIGEFVHVRPHTLIEGDTTIRDGEKVGPFAWIKDDKHIGRHD